MLNETLSGARVRIRPIRTDDRQELAAFYARLSPDSRFARFHAVSRGIGEEAAGVLCGPDHEHREGFVAECPDAQPGRLEIIGHICLEPGESGIEMAIAVADKWQGQGIGRALLRAAVSWAQSHGIARLQASVLATNVAVLRLIASISHPVRESAPSAGVIVATIDIDATVPQAA
jgi:GNAT superfamily N-acetyltransferase